MEFLMFSGISFLRNLMRITRQELFLWNSSLIPVSVFSEKRLWNSSCEEGSRICRTLNQWRTLRTGEHEDRDVDCDPVAGDYCRFRMHGEQVRSPQSLPSFASFRALNEIWRWPAERQHAGSCRGYVARTRKCRGLPWIAQHTPSQHHRAHPHQS